MLKALPGFALIELPKKYESGLTTEKEKYAMRSEGTLKEFIHVNEVPSASLEGLEELIGNYRYSVGKTVYFAPFEDGEIIKDDGKEYVFVPVGSLRGVKDAEA